MNTKTQELIQEHKHVKAYRKRLRRTLGSFNNFKATKLTEMITTVAIAEYEDLYEALDDMDTEAIVYVVRMLSDLALVATGKKDAAK